MKKLVFLLVLLLGVTYSYSQKPVNPSKNPTTKPINGQQSQPDSVIYMTPTGSVYDTVQVLAVIASLKEPLTLQSYQLITKSWIYENGKKQPADQFLEKVTGEIATPVKNWRKRTVYIVAKNEFEE